MKKNSKTVLLESYNFSFVDNDSFKLAGMSYPYDIKEIEKGLKENNIIGIVTLTHSELYEREIAESKGFECLHLPVRQDHHPDFEQIKTFLKFVKKFNEKKKSVVVHCKNGRGRTTSMLMCFMLNQKYGSYTDCLKLLEERRPKGKAVIRNLQRKFITKNEKEIAEMEI